MSIDWSVNSSSYGCEDFKDEGGMWVSSFRSSDGSISTQNHTRSGYLWFDLLKRTQIGGRFQRKYPAYAGVTLGFKSYQQFAEWAISQPGYGCRDAEGKIFQLDKDILIPGSKLYSPDTCAFVPAHLNSILNISRRSRGPLTLGVSIDRSTGRYRARAKKKGVTVGLGTFSTTTEAHKAWQRFKAECLMEAAYEYQRNEWSRMDVAQALIARSYRLLKDADEGTQTICL
ncbi:hypothetical protein I5102_003427 [Pseudomonas aeruginosa]|uniref:hypothetical protein n=1 Tax=Pseudomonas aeruginosa TaxID=287 RepID=UPI0018B08B9A|nr:hypothetical protein [Pseudomonas aeruginosa]QPP24936.1 hypothetical protein I5102_003427 [Pseudomonas aeruginosa]